MPGIAPIQGIDEGIRTLGSELDNIIQERNRERAMLQQTTQRNDEDSFRELYRMTERLTVGVDTLKEQMKGLAERWDKEHIPQVEYTMLKRLTLINTVAILILFACLGGVLIYLLANSG